MKSRTTATPGQIDLVLDNVLRLFRTHSPELIRDCETRIVAHLRTTPEQRGYIDEVELSDILARHPNLIGTVVRGLLRREVMAKTGAHKRSRRPDSNGRIIWEYQLKQP